MISSSGASGNTQTIRNIIVGVITTVLASTIVYFLGFHSSKRSSAEAMLFTEKATIAAWTDYVATENTFTKNWNTLAAGYSHARFKNYKEATLEELDKFFKDINILIGTNDIDPGFVSLLKRRMTSRKQWENKYKVHLDNFESILNNTPQQEQVQKLNDEINRFGVEVKDLDERFKNEIENTAQALSEKYHHNFSLSDLVAFRKTNIDSLQNVGGRVGQVTTDRQSMIGTWIITQQWYVYQYGDGRLYMYFTRDDGAKDSTYGTWQITNNQLYHYSTHYFNAGNNWVYDVSDITPNSFTMKLTISPYTVYMVRRFN